MSEPISYFEHAKALANAAAPIPPGEDNMNAHGQAYEMPVSPGARVKCESTEQAEQPSVAEIVDRIADDATEAVEHGLTYENVRGAKAVISVAITRAINAALAQSEAEKAAMREALRLAEIELDLTRTTYELHVKNESKFVQWRAQSFRAVMAKIQAALSAQQSTEPR